MSDSDLIRRGIAEQAADATDIAHIPAVKIGVKKLVWEKGSYGRLFAKTPFCQYSVRDFGEGRIWADRDGTLLRPHHTDFESAKAAAQEDYEARVLSSIVEIDDEKWRLK